MELVRETGAAYHVCHVSAAETVEVIRRAKAEGLNVSCETGPHYLMLCDEDITENGRFKMNPPLRSSADREALIQGIADGTVDMIATDHAPHSAEEKSRGLEKSAMGVVGLETSFAAVYTALVRTGRITLERLVELMSAAPAARFGIESGVIEGKRAAINVFDLDSRYTVDPDKFLTKGRATPFAGMELYGKCEMTILGDSIPWIDEDMSEVDI
jgi:dihydroorotase